MDKLAVRPEETRKFRATIEKAKGMTAALGRFRTRVANSSAWLESAADSISLVRANCAPKQQHPERSNDSGCAKSDEAFLRLIALRDKRLAKNARVEYIDGKRYEWAPGMVADRRSSSISSTFAPTPNRYGILGAWDDADSAETTHRAVRFDEQGVRHPTREEARPKKLWTLPPSVRAQNAKEYHTGNDRRNSERELFTDIEAVKELMEVKNMCEHQKKVVVDRRKISRRPR